MIHFPTALRALPLILAVSACAPGAPETPAEVTRADGTPVVPAEGNLEPPAGAAPGTCWAEDRAPGAGPGQMTRFETPCPEALTADFLRTLQRALAARHLYSGRITGRLDETTREALRHWQSERGLNSGLLAMATARELGLVAMPRAAAAPEPGPGPTAEAAALPRDAPPKAVIPGGIW